MKAEVRPDYCQVCCEKLNEIEKKSVMSSDYFITCNKHYCINKAFEFERFGKSLDEDEDQPIQLEGLITPII